MFYILIGGIIILKLIISINIRYYSIVSLSLIKDNSIIIKTQDFYLCNSFLYENEYLSSFAEASYNTKKKAKDNLYCGLIRIYKDIQRIQNVSGSIIINDFKIKRKIKLEF